MLLRPLALRCRGFGTYLGLLAALVLFVAAAPAHATNVLVLPHTDYTASLANIEFEINDFYNAQAGITSSIDSGALTASDLVGVDLLVAPNVDPFSAAEISLMGDFLGAGGRIFFLADNPTLPTGIYDANAALAGLGSSISLSLTQLPTETCGVGVDCAAGVVPHALTSGVGLFRYIAPSETVGGETLFTTQTYGTPFVAYEALGGGSVVVSGDTNITDDLFGANDNGVFFRNVANVQASYLPEPSCAALLLGLALPLADRERRRRA